MTVFLEHITKLGMICTGTDSCCREMCPRSTITIGFEEGHHFLHSVKEKMKFMKHAPFNLISHVNPWTFNKNLLTKVMFFII